MVVKWFTCVVLLTLFVSLVSIVHVDNISPTDNLEVSKMIPTPRIHWMTLGASSTLAARSMYIREWPIETLDSISFYLYFLP